MEREKVYEVKIAPVAYHDISRHFYFLAKVSKEAAKRLKITLLGDIRSLKNMPQRHPVFERRGTTPGKYRQMISAGRYRIVYQIVQDEVRVDGVEDCRQDNESKTT